MISTAATELNINEGKHSVIIFSLIYCCAFLILPCFHYVASVLFVCGFLFRYLSGKLLAADPVKFIIYVNKL